MRMFWKTALRDEASSADVVFDLLVRSATNFAEVHVACEEAAAELRTALKFRQEHKAAWTRIEEASRKRAREDDSLQFVAEPEQGSGRRLSKPVCSSGSEDDYEEDVASRVYVVTKGSQQGCFQQGAPRCRSIQRALRSILGR